MSFNQFILKEQYLKVQGLGDRLKLIKEQIKWLRRDAYYVFWMFAEAAATLPSG